MKIVAVIPARGGSKGIPAKNLQKLAGRTLVAHRVEVARKSKCNEIYVSTDDDSIKSECANLLVKVIDRPKELAQDDSSTDAVLDHAISQLGLMEDDYVVLLQPTSPFISTQIIDRCINLLIENPDLNSVITLNFGHTFVWELQEKFIQPVNHNRKLRLRRQDMPVSGIETGGCYVFRVSKFLETKVRFPEPTGGISVNQLEALDIDTLDDLRLAQKLVSNFYD